MGVAALAACGSDGSGAPDVSPSAGDLASLTKALAALPADEVGANAWISWGDLDIATEAAGAERPPADAEAEALMAWLRALSADRGGDVFVPLPFLLAGPATIARQPDIRAELGWSIIDVGRYAEIHAPPRGSFFLATGALEVDGEGVQELGGDIHTAGTGPDGEPSADGDRTAARPLGVPLRLARADGVLAASTSTDAVERWLAGDGPRLVDEDGYATVAAALDDAGVIGAVVFPHVRAGVAWDADLVGMGWTRPGGSAQVVLAFHLFDPAQADEAAAALDRELREGHDLRGRALTEHFSVVDVGTRDGVVTATVRPTRSPRVLHDLLVRRDTPFVPRGR